uniref:Mobile element protein n=1 Tax=Steinernema glaseri TaxID=37863 RepID=A0A1I8AKE7_9BILA
MSDPVLEVCPECNQPTFTKQVTAAGFQLKASRRIVALRPHPLLRRHLLPHRPANTIPYAPLQALFRHWPAHLGALGHHRLGADLADRNAGERRAGVSVFAGPVRPADSRL